MAQELRSEVRFAWRYLIDLITGVCPAGVLTLVPTTGETDEQWWGRQLKEGRGAEAQRLLESEFVRLFDLGLLREMTVLIPVRSDVPPSGDLYRSRYAGSFLYLTDHESVLSGPVRESLAFQMQAGRAERIELVTDADIKAGPGKQARWWVVPGSLIALAEEDKSKQWVLHNIRNEAIRHRVEPVCIDELDDEQMRMAYSYGISLVGGATQFVDDILAAHESSPFGLDPGESPFSQPIYHEDFGDEAEVVADG